MNYEYFHFANGLKEAHIDDSFISTLRIHLDSSAGRSKALKLL